ncbi:ABC transporter ATP-binding protein [Croceivirga sp. JEA036]|uniref:ABC transporter ATP-binding protein n=1 Tax=Croceivirga sp. JEA036 TaxID=2721162 RepID=UPI00143BCCA7|nr:ABC transporter ATP-binding protein [Croceivirga sp. JEA036]NJB36843.1 ABC transporter ATP-binding protein [Croceivirga sp. JEA036]
MITIQQLLKTYSTEEVETTALNQISLQVNQGDFMAIMGPSGCGKSTLLNVIGLLDSFDNGSYQFLGQEMHGLKEKDRAQVRKENIGFIFQNFNLIDELNVYENIELPLVYNNIAKKERKERVIAVMERLNIAHRNKHYPQQLSGGQQQRVAVARALVTAPKIILADEPTGNLDSTNGNEVMELLSELNHQGSTILMVTHSSYDASFSNRIVTLKDGNILMEKENQRQVAIV